MTINEYLNNSVSQKPEERVDESLILGAIVASACLSYALTPMLNTDFMKSVGAGLGGILKGFGGMFGGLGSKLGIGKPNKDEIKELLKKDPADLTQSEKEKINKAANDPKMSKEFTDNELKKIKKMNNSSSEDDEVSDTDSNKETLQDEEVSPEQISEAMIAIAAAANENETDEDKKKKNAAMIDIITASTYGDDGKPLSMDERLEKMKGLVGKDNWESFEADMKETTKDLDEKKVEEELKKAKKELKPEDIKELQDNQKKRAKDVGERIAKENKEREDLEKEIDELKKDPESNTDKIKELEGKREELINKSTLGSASPNTVKAAIERTKKEDKGDKGEPKPKEETDGEEPKKSKEEIEKEHKEKSDALEKEYNEKIEKAKDKEEKDKLEDEWTEKQAKLDAVKNKAVDEIEDEGKSDDEKKSKYKEKEEEVTDPETGKKVKVTTYTGPRGGKFYWPKGSPHDTKHKVYVECISNMHEHLTSCMTPISTFLKSLF